MTRILAGRFKGKALETPDGLSTRPTASRTREALFNILAHADWSPLANGGTPRVIDGFAGSGALGLEAMSRGAAFALFIETDADARGVIRNNIEHLGLFGNTRIHRRDATKLGPKPANLGAPFDLVFLDPPYNKGLIMPSLKALKDGEWLTPTAVIVAEVSATETLDVPDYTVLDDRTHGAARVLIMQCN